MSPAQRMQFQLKRAAGAALLCMIAVAGCADDPATDQASAVCSALQEERFDDAISLSSAGAGPVGVARDVASCRCIALLSKGDRAGCTDLLDPLLADQRAEDWVPHIVLSKLMVRTWHAAGEIERAAAFAARVAPTHREDLDLLQLELMLRSQIEDEESTLVEIESRLKDDPSWLSQRLVLALAWDRRSRPEAAIRVLGEEAPPVGHPLALPWFESRIQAQAKAADLIGVQETFAAWRATGWDPIDLDARYALRVSVDHLRDPNHHTVDLLQNAIATQTSLRDQNIIWGLHHRLVVENLAAGRPEAALVAYDAAVQVVTLDGITREEIVRAVRLADGSYDPSATATLRLIAPEEAEGGYWSLSPPSSSAPDQGYVKHLVSQNRITVVATQLGLHPQRWILRDKHDRLMGSGSFWPEPGATLEIVAMNRATSSAPEAIPTIATPRRPADGTRRVFAILADCGDWRLSEYLRNRGDLPFQDQLMREGYRAVLESRPAFTAAAMRALVWPTEGHTSASSLDWLHQMGLELAGLESVGANPLELLSWFLPERPNLFETIGAGSVTTANMLLAHGAIDAGRHAEIVGPHGARRDLPSQQAYRALSESERNRYPDLLGDPDTRKFAQTIAAEMDAAEAIARAGEVDFLFLRLEALDLITHGHYSEIDGRGQDDGQGPLLSAYRYIDERLVALDALLDEDDWLVYLSDHGIRSAMQHEEDALFFIKGEGVPQGRASGQPALRGVPRTLAAMLDVSTPWPDTGTAPWLAITALAESNDVERSNATEEDARVAAHQ